MSTGNEEDACFQEENCYHLLDKVKHQTRIGAKKAALPQTFHPIDKPGISG